MGKIELDGALQSFLNGFPYLVTHFGATLVMLALGAFIYVRVTPHDEMKLIREGNQAAAISFGAALLGLAIPLSVSMANSVNLFDIVIWGLVTLAIQILTFRVIDAWLKDLSERIENGETAAAIFLASVKLSVAAVNAAAVSG
ncbi:MAG: DUF350 domain-containing protein [Rhodospirillaceae bacterium]|nr:DUF350 domain-containing protein [Rhodospirillaceae bacterium]MBT6137797.1 DUF350 domain-containing protein [Rhodospirillaceae bacterium]